MSVELGIVENDRRSADIAITAVVATYNEELHIGRCLTGLLSQVGVAGGIEIIVVDGMSTDRTVDIVRSFPEFGSRIRLILNPRRLQVYAWNIALSEARGDYFGMILAHADYAPTYFACCLEVLGRTGAAAVGGVQHPFGDGPLGRAIAWSMSNAFGIGNARFRYASKEIESDSIFSIFTRSKAIKEVGGYDERIPFDEDSDLNYRLRNNGGKLVVSPRIQVRYFVRQSLKGLWKQMYRYGYWRRHTQLKHGSAVPMRVYAPAALLLGLLCSLIIVFSPYRWIGLILPCSYGAFLLLAAAAATRKLGRCSFLVPIVILTMHAAYGLGHWSALLTVRRLPPGKSVGA